MPEIGAHSRGIRDAQSGGALYIAADVPQPGTRTLPVPSPPGYAWSRLIRLVYSNRTEELARALGRDLEASQTRPGGSVFDPFVLVVPNRNIETFVKLALVRTRGIAANLEVHLLRRFLSTAAARASRDARIVDPEMVLGLILDRLVDEASLGRPELAPVRHYLTAAGDAADAVDLRRVALASRIAHLFEEYGYARPDMLRAWNAGPTLASTSYASAETWQRRIWLDLFGEGGLVAARAEAAGKRLLSLADLFAEANPAALDVPPRVHLFGISYVSRAFHTLFGRLSEACDLHIYTLNPCMEFWEDVGESAPERDSTRFPRRARYGVGSALLEDEDPFHLDAPSDPPALRLWGRPGRENVRLLNELAACDFEAAFVDPRSEASSVLARLQHDILVRAEERASPDDVDAVAVDESIHVLACPSVRREAEAVASALWTFVRDTDARASEGDRPRLRFNEIAVIVPSGAYDAYHTHLKATFDECFGIPHHVLDVPLARTSRIAEALDLLFTLPFGTFTRKEVMRVVLHPAVMARFPEVPASAWIDLPPRIGVVHGADHDDHAGTYIARDILNWDQGLRRLALGAFMTSEATGDARPFVAGDEAYLPVESPSHAREASTALGALVTSLLADARYARSAELTMPEWATFLRTLATSYVQAGDEAEERALFDCLGALASLADIDLGGRNVSYRIASELARASLAGLTSGGEGYLASGVAIASFLPMRAIPFKAIFVMGLGEGMFPQGDPRDPLDLRLAKRRIGDVRPREQDKYMFLETLLCARERLYLSYVDRDALTGEPLAPSSVVTDLLAMLARGYVGESGVSKMTTRFPLRRYGEAELPTVYGRPGSDRFGASPEARREAVAAALRRDLEAHLGRPAPRLTEIRAAVSAPVKRALEEHLGLTSVPPSPGAIATNGTLEVPMSALRAFLECPLQGYARFRLGLDDADDDDPLATEDEPLETPVRDRTLFLRRVLLDALTRGAPHEDVYVEHRTRLELSGVAPTGIFAEAEREGHLEVLAGWRSLVDKRLGDAAATLSTIRFGRAAEHAEAGTLRDAVVLDAPQRCGDDPVVASHVVLHGATQPVSSPPRSSWIFVARKPPTPGDRGLHVRRRAIPAFLDHVVLAASDAAGAPAHAVNVCFALDGENECHAIVFPALSREAARAYLEALAADMLSRPHAYLLPCEAALTYQVEKGARPIAAIVAELVDAFKRQPERSRFSSVEGPVDHAEAYPVPDDSDARAMVEGRFGLFGEGVLEKEDP